MAELEADDTSATEPDDRASCQADHHPVPDEPSPLRSSLRSYFAGALGVALFIGSFILLYDNEGRIDAASLIRGALAVEAAAPAPDATGKLVTVSGPLRPDGMLGDGFLAPAPRLVLARQVEVFAWVEETKIHPQKFTTIVAYKRIWTASPPDSRAFKVPVGHTNPAVGIKPATWLAKSARIGAVALDLEGLSLPASQPVALGADDVRNGVAADRYVYVGAARPRTPKVGDTRLTYLEVAPAGAYTALGKLAAGPKLVAWQADQATIHDLQPGTRADALGRLGREHGAWVWGLRLLGFMMMWGGMRLMMEPFNALFDRVPVLESLGRGMAGALTFPLALVLSAVTIGVAWITHSFAAMLVAGLLTVAAFGGVLMLRRAPAATS